MHILVSISYGTPTCRDGSRVVLVAGQLVFGVVQYRGCVL